MKTKLFFRIIMSVIISSILVSCGTSNKVASNFGKRKYTKGHFSDPVAKMNTVARPSTPTEIKKAEVKNTSPILSKPTDSRINFSGVSKKNTKVHSYDNANDKNRTQVFIPSKSDKISITKKPQVSDKNNLTIKESPASHMDSPGRGEESGSSSDSNICGILGFVFGLLGLLLSWFLGGFLFLIAGLILSIIGLKNPNNHIFAVLGLIFSIVGLVIWLIVALLIILILGSTI